MTRLFKQTLIVSILCLQSWYSNSSTAIHLATTSWCPYACDQSEIGQGIVFDYLSYLLEKEGYELVISFQPWSRAIRMANTDRLHGLLTAVHSEAPDLAFTSEPTMNYRMCFYGKDTYRWQYQSAKDFETVMLAVIQDYGYGEPLDSYINQSDEMLFTIQGDNSLHRLLMLLNKNRFNIFIEDENVVKAQKDKEKLSGFSQKGCLDSIPFYVAFSPKFNQEHQIVEKLNVLLAKKEHQDYLKNTIMPKYLGSF